MKKNNYIVYCLSIFLLIGCTKNEADIFPYSAAERLNSAMKDDFKVLTDAENGWAMQYFATTKSSGYTLLVKFETSGKATFAAKNEFTLNKQYETDTCLFEMIGDDGPVLTFNTYNKILHVFSNPVDPLGTDKLDGSGLEGDYEFVVTKTSVDQLVLKGKKRGTVIILNKIPTNVTWSQYVTDLDAMNTLLFSNNAPTLTTTIANSTYSFSNGANHIFNILKAGAGSTTAVDAPFIVTRTGIRLQESQEIAGVKCQSFNLSDDKSSLVCVENPSLKLVGAEDLAIYFAANLSTWEFVPTELSPNVKAIYDQIVQSCVTKYNATNVKLAIKYNTLSTRKSFDLTLTFLLNKTKTTEGNLDIKVAIDQKNTLTISDKSTSDANGKSFYTNVAGLKDMLTLISSGFALSTDASINPRSIKFTQKLNNNTWFTVLAQ